MKSQGKVREKYLQKAVGTLKLWYCPKCTVLQNAENFPFGLESTYELNKINMSNSMKLVEMIPEFEINSQILRVDDLCSKDSDENLVNNINCKYFYQ